jgi:hypothetical protein
MGTPIEPSGEVQGGNDGGTVENAPGPNPAWADVLGVIPESLHPAVTPHFEKWDQSAQQRIESLNQQVTQFESYKPFVESGISPQDLEQGLQLMYQLNTNPQGVYQALAEAYGFAQQQGLELVAQTILQQQQQKIEAEADAEVDAELKQLKEKHPGISEEFALALMVNGFDVNQVGERWQAMSQGLLQQNPRPFAPSVLGTNGGGTGLPSQAIDPRKMSGVDRRNLVAQMAQHMMNQP